MSGRFSLLLPFDSDDPTFTRGFEAGALWAQLSAASWTVGVDEDHGWYQLHETNLEMAIRIGEALSLECRLVGESPGWIEVQYSAAP